MNWGRFTIAAAVSLGLIPFWPPPARASEPSSRPTTRPVAGSAKPRVIARLKGHGGSFICFSPDGALLITVGNKDLQVWDGTTFSPVGKPVACSQDFVTAGFAAGGHVAYFADSKGLWLWDPRTGKPIGPGIKAPSQVWAAAVSPDGTRAALNWQPPEEIFGERLIRLFDTRTGKELRRLPHIDWTVFATFSPDGRRLLTFERVWTSGHFHMWDVAGGQDLFPAIETGCNWNCPPGLNSSPGVFTADGRRFAAVTNRLFAVFETETGKLLAGKPKADDFGPSVYGLRFSADGQWVLCVRGDGALLCDAATAIQRDYEAFIPGGFFDFSMSGDDTRVACRYRVARYGNASTTGVGIWDLRTRTLLHRLGGETEDGIPAFSPSGDRLAVTGTGASKEDTIIWDVPAASN